LHPVFLCVLCGSHIFLRVFAAPKKTSLCPLWSLWFTYFSSRLPRQRRDHAPHPADGIRRLNARLHLDKPLRGSTQPDTATEP
jgi:hypothetical protein